MEIVTCDSQFHFQPINLPWAREPWRHGSPNFLPCGAMLTQLSDHKLVEQKAISGWQLFFEPVRPTYAT